MKLIQYYLFSMVTILFTQSANGQDSLVAYWSFNALNGEVFSDESGNGYHGTNNGAELVPGIAGKALGFDGLNDFASVSGEASMPPEVFSELGSGSISLWFKVEHIPEENGIAPVFYYGNSEKCDFFDAANEGLIIEVGHSPVHYRSKRLYFTIWKNGCTLPSFCYDSNDPIEIGKWYHFVAVVGEDYNTGYLNGKEMKNRRYNFGNSSYSQFFEDAVVHERLWLGKGHWDRTVQFFKGAIDEVKVFSKALSAEEVEMVYNEAVGSPTGISLANKGSNEIKLFPNPAMDLIRFDISELDDKIDGVRIIDMNGRTMLERKINSNEGEMNLENFKSGYYNLEFYGININYRKKVLVR